MSNNNYINVLSLGAWKQSIYMLLNALRGNYKYNIDYAIMSDLKNEPKYVYDYLEYIKAYIAEKYNFQIIIVDAGDLVEDTLAYINGDKDRCSSIPYFVDSEPQSIIMRQCTRDYKIAPIRRYLQKIRDGKKVRLWIGISLDEIERITKSGVKYIENYYPLIENRISISNIIKWYQDNNIRVPGKSACFICPFHSNNYYRRFKKEFPLEFEKACTFDDKIRVQKHLKYNAYLHRSLIPLREVDFSYTPSLFPELIEECSGLCGL